MENFITKFERDLKQFDQELERLISIWFGKNKSGTTHEIIEFIKNKHQEFNDLYHKNSTKAWYRVRKILEGLKRKNILEKSLTIDQTKRIKFLTYKWVKHE